MELICVTSPMWQGNKDGREMKTKEDCKYKHKHVCVVCVCTQVRGVAGVALSSHHVGLGG